MAGFPADMEVCLPKLSRVLSARRLWEHTDRGQVNPFPTPISPSADPASFIDIAHGAERWHVYVESACALRLRAATEGVTDPDRSVLASVELVQLQERVAVHLKTISLRRAIRVQHSAFLPVDRRQGLGRGLGVKGLYSAVQRHLETSNQRVSERQWYGTLRNLPRIREEELSFLGMVESNERLTGPELARRIRLEGAWLSIVPVVSDAERPLRWSRVSPSKFRPTRLRHTLKVQHERTVVFFEHALGYRVEQLDFDTFWGPQRWWQAVKYDGTVIEQPNGRTACESVSGAVRVAESDAQSEFPKSVAYGRWGSYAFNGGAEYREWLVTLPFHLPSFRYPVHFDIRNVLMHMRCDIREGLDGERILLVHELQSDWCQAARRGEVPAPPFAKEWTSLGLKVLLLHAAQHAFDGIAWTTGEEQAKRWAHGEAGLRQLYDRSLPADCDAILKPFGIPCGWVDVYVPFDYNIGSSEEGYTLTDEQGTVLAIAETFEEAQAQIPNGAEDRLLTCHGVLLRPEARAKILELGFPAWGTQG